MKAAITKEYGSPDLIEIQQVPIPTLKPDQVLVKIHATTVNRTDHAMLRAIPFAARLVTGFFKPKFPIQGTEYAGEVVQLGEKLGGKGSKFQIGDRVFGFKESGFGAHAQYCAVSEEEAIEVIPTGFSFAEAAPCTEATFYAHNMFKRLPLKAGERVLVHGATGAIGSASVQLAAHYGAEVTATCRPEHTELVKSLGAVRCIDYTTQDFTTEQETYHYILDTVGKSTFGKCKPLLKPNGIYISGDLGPMAQNLFFAVSTPITGGKKVIFPLPTDCKGSLLLTRQLMEDGKFKAVIDRSYPLEEISDAYWYVESAQKVGNVIIQIDHQDTP